MSKDWLWELKKGDKVIVANRDEYVWSICEVSKVTKTQIEVAEPFHDMPDRKIKYSKRDGIPFLLLTSSSRTKINAFRQKYGFNVPVFVNDETGLKAIARSNPSLMVIEKGIVKGKFPHRSIPSYQWLKKNTFKQ